MPINLLRFILLFPFLGFLYQAQTPIEVLISQPAEGVVVRGVVQVMGTAAGQGFVSYDLVYAFENSTTPNWFSISNQTREISNGVLGSWDTTSITDGDYSLKLTVHFQDGSQQESLIQHVLVRNYTSAGGIAGGTQTVQTTRESLEGQGASTGIQPPTSGNPATLLQEVLKRSLYLGLAIGIGSILLLGIYRWLRQLSRR